MEEQFMMKIKVTTSDTEHYKQIIDQINKNKEINLSEI